jgi:3-oxoacyl-[acyl-carrier protein] reductase/dehydrogenase/reductase SDR family protein 4
VDLEGKVSLITGGTSGIGAATAQKLALKGSRIALASRGKAPHTRRELLAISKASGSAARYFEADVANPAACRNCVDWVIENFGRIDVLVLSAGGAVPGGLFEVTDESWMDAFAVHVHSVFHFARAAVPHMMRQGEGAIILLGSAAGLRGCLGALAYGAVKGALPQLARSLARELANHHIRVNCVSPGIIRTPFQAPLTPEKAKYNMESRIPLRKEGRPEDVADLIVSVIENDFITGENFVIDGGMTMRIA